MKRLIFDLDNTLCTAHDGDYQNASPNQPLIEKLRDYKANGYEIVISTSRNVRTFDGCVGKINKITLPVIIDWLNKYDVPFDEIYVGKPWCGVDGFYIDDRAVRPKEFLELNHEQIKQLIEDCFDSY